MLGSPRGGVFPRRLLYLIRNSKLVRVVPLSGERPFPTNPGAPVQFRVGGVLIGGGLAGLINPDPPVGGVGLTRGPEGVGGTARAPTPPHPAPPAPKARSPVA